MFIAWMMSAPSHREQQAEAPAEQRGAADHHGKDRIQFEPQAGIVGVRAHDVGGRNDAGERRAQAAPGVDREDHGARSDAGKFAGARIAAGCLDQKPERRAAHDRAGKDKHAGDDDHGNRQAKHAAIAEPDQIRRREGDDASLGDELGNAPARDHQDQGGDDRLDAEDGDEEAVPQAAQKARAERGGEHQRQAMAIGKARRDGARDRHHRADREIDAAGGDHQHHAERQQRHRRAAVEDVDEAAEQAAVLQAQVEELRRDRAVDQEDDDERYDLGKAAARQT